MKRLDLIGQKFGRLTVIEFSHTDGEKSYWLCKCNCGNETIVIGNNLKRGTTNSCGCLKKELIRQRIALPEGVAARNKVIHNHKMEAKRRNLEQVLTDEQIIALHKDNCHYCGAPPSNTYFPVTANGPYIYNGIDRINNTKGYTLANVVSCCKYCNKAKNDQSYDEFLDRIKRIHSHLKL